MKRILTDNPTTFGSGDVTTPSQAFLSGWEIGRYHEKNFRCSFRMGEGQCYMIYGINIGGRRLCHWHSSAISTPQSLSRREDFDSWLEWMRDHYGHPRYTSIWDVDSDNLWRLVRGYWVDIKGELIALDAEKNKPIQMSREEVAGLISDFRGHLAKMETGFKFPKLKIGDLEGG